MKTIKLLFRDAIALDHAVDLLNINGFYNSETFSIDDFISMTSSLPDELIDFDRASSHGKYYVRYYCASDDEMEAVRTLACDRMDCLDMESGEISEETIKEYLELKHEVIVSDRLLITSSREKCEKPFDHVIFLVPGMGFGTGEHETTKDSLKLMLSLEGKFESFLDIGCGSGILSILAAKMDAKVIDGFDIDPPSVQNAIENCILNGVECNLTRGDVFEYDPGRTYELVAANIYADILVKASGRISGMCSKYLILSGIVKDKWEMVMRSFGEGFLLSGKVQSNEWVTGILIKQTR